MRILPVFSIILCLFSISAQAKIDASQIERFADELAAQSNWSAAEARKVLAGAKFKDSIIKAISRPAERAKPWHDYRDIFLTEQRIEGGVAFWRKHEDLLARAERDFGVDPAVIVAIIGVETRYGGNIGSYRVLDALYTLGFGYPKRAKFFRSELMQFLRLTREEQIELNKAKGSYAGAMGKPQFIPSSYRRYAVDYDADGRRDLWGSDADIIGSVGNYLALHGWEAGKPVIEPVRVGEPVPASHKEKGLKPWTRVGELQRQQVQVPDGLDPRAAASLIELQQPNNKEYWLGLKNFYVITRYNHSALYAMAVWQLSRAIQERVEDVDVDSP